MSHGPAGLVRQLGENGKREKPIRPYTQRTEARSSSVARATSSHFHLKLSISICDLQRKMRGASDALTSASAHPRAWRGEGERKRARAARVVNKSLLMSKAQRASERVAMSSGVSSTSHISSRLGICRSFRIALLSRWNMRLVSFSIF